MMLEFTAERGQGDAAAPHPNEDEGIYVLEGEIVVHIDGEEHRVGEGGMFIAPRGVPHAFMVTSETAHLLAWQTPGTGEAVLRRGERSSRPDADSSRPPDWERLREVAERSTPSCCSGRRRSRRSRRTGSGQRPEELCFPVNAGVFDDAVFAGARDEEEKSAAPYRSLSQTRERNSGVSLEFGARLGARKPAKTKRPEALAEAPWP